MTPVVLRDYQAQSEELLRDGIRRSLRLQVLAASAGSGKTEVAASMVSSCYSKHRRALFIVDRITLVEQTSKRFDKYGIPHGVIQGGHWRTRLHERVQIASAQTLESRGFPDDFDLVIVDECHAMRRQVVEYLRRTKAIVIGLSATPLSKGMGDLYQGVVNVTTTNKLIEAGHLVPLKVYAAQRADMKGARLDANGEYRAQDIDDRTMPIIGDVVAGWVQKTHMHFGGPVKTICFSPTVDSGAEFCRQFNAAGYNFKQISYKDGDDETRKAIIDDFERPDTEITGLISCEIFTKGFDNPGILCGISARPYRKSLSSHIQQLGRVQRPYPGKEYGLWLCLARGSKVLTDSGLVPIEQVTIDHKVWDGYNFVNHGGAVCNGRQRTITYRGLTATAGHLVHTKDGWRTFGSCASEQIRITQTGFGGKPVRMCGDNFTRCGLAGAEEKAVYTRCLRMPEMRLSNDGWLIKPSKWKHWWVQGMRKAASVLSAMAVRKSSSNACSLQESIRCKLSKLWRSWRRVQIRWGEGWHSMDHRQYWATKAGLLHSTGQDRPVWSLRTWEHSMAGCAGEPVEQARASRDCQTTQVQDEASRNSLFGQHLERIPFFRNGLRRDHIEVSEAIEETEREVWDILDAGPFNRFTCEGLLVHNCNSGNYLRFQQETDKIFEEGIHELDNGAKEDACAKKSTDDIEKKGSKCRHCGFVMPPGAQRCPACGKERVRNADVEMVAGDLVEVGASKKDDVTKLPAHDLFDQLSYWALEKSKGDVDRANRMAVAKYKTWTGRFPKGHFGDRPPMVPSKLVIGRIQHDNIAYAKGKGKK